ncbi:integrin beta-1-binding protein 1-like isoform X1 [Mytilus edulis]|uniref:integrin beta-1-binding protein 1-like isoform X1 n=1 Tax=Mytilus edulis TaxID=6550 RepID=UPI0039EEE345
MFWKKTSKSSQHNVSQQFYNSALVQGNPGTDSRKDGRFTPDKVLLQKMSFDVYFLGMVEEANMGNSIKRDTEAQLVDHVEEAQIEGRLPVSVIEENRVTMCISRHGLKIVDQGKQEVKQRHPLQTLAQVIQYEDGSGKPNIVVKIGQLQSQHGGFQCYVYQCKTDEQAHEICQYIRKIFDAISNKS